jgi:hypothetical protein
MFDHLQRHNDGVMRRRDAWLDSPYDEPEDYGYDRLRAALRQHDTTHWDWVEIDVCLSGKHAEVDPGGRIGFRLIRVDDEYAYLVAHAHKSVAGTDAVLNLPDGPVREQYLACREAYLELAQEMIIDIGGPGEWDGDSWSLHATEEFRVPIVSTRDQTDLDVERTAARILKEARKILGRFSRNYTRLDRELEKLAGFRDWRGRKVRAGSLPPNAAFAYVVAYGRKGSE